MVTYKSDMLNFGYGASLHINHPKTSLQDVSERLGLVSKSTHKAGDPRTTPKGTALTDTYFDHYWYGELRTEDQQDLTEFLRRIVVEFES